MNSHLPILIIGAGPTGLMMACELARFGIPFRIIDKQAGPTKMANAAWIQTRTLEILDHIGIVDRFLQAGNRCDAINLYIDGKPVTNIPFNTIDSVYPFVLIMPQSETENILNKRLEELQVRIERQVELVDIKPKIKGTEVILRNGKGRMEKINCTWVIACDGARSTVREKCHLYFPGSNISEQFMVADAEMESYMDKNAIHVFLDRETVVAALPFGKDNYRIAANLHMKNPRATFTGNEAIEMVQERSHGNYYVNQVKWVSPVGIHGKMLKTMREGQIFLAGDAAHIHSPVGGQGMNAGMQDAYNLAWKLALVVKNNAKPSILDSYVKERQPIIKAIINETEKFTFLAVGDKTPFLTKLRTFSQKIAGTPGSHFDKLCEQLTHLGIQYKNSSIIDYSVKLNSNAPRQGARMPNVRINENKKLYDYLRNTQHNILIFLSKTTTQNLIKISELQAWVEKEFANLVRVHVISREKISDVDSMIHDPHGQLPQRLNIEGTAIYVARPDTYISYASHNLAVNPVKKLFAKYAKIPAQATVKSP